MPLIERPGGDQKDPTFKVTMPSRRRRGIMCLDIPDDVRGDLGLQRRSQRPPCALPRDLVHQRLAANRTRWRILIVGITVITGILSRPALERGLTRFLHLDLSGTYASRLIYRLRALLERPRRESAPLYDRHHSRWQRTAQPRAGNAAGSVWRTSLECFR